MHPSVKALLLRHPGGAATVEMVERAAAPRLTFEIHAFVGTWKRSGRSGRRSFTTAEDKANRAAVAMAALVARQRLPSPWPLDARYRLVVAIPREYTGDCSNYQKLVEDSCQGRRGVKGSGILWDDDRQVDDGRCYRADVPCVCVSVEARVIADMHVPPIEEVQRELTRRGRVV